MAEQSVVHSTFVVERSYPAAPEVVFAAFAEPAKKRLWFVEGAHKEIDEYEMDFRVGGVERARYRYREGSPYPSVPFVYEASYQNIVANRRIVAASTLTLGDRCISAALMTFEFAPSEAGTDLIFTHQGAFFEGADGPQIREMGWRILLEQRLAGVLTAELARDTGPAPAPMQELAGARS